RPLLLLAAPAALVALTGCSARNLEAGAQAQGLPPRRRPPRVGAPQPGDGARACPQPAATHGSGGAQPESRAPSYPKAPAVATGGRVRAGQVLAVIESPELHDQQRQARAAYEQSLAATEGARAARGRAEADARQAGAQIDRARADAEQGAAGVAKATAD